MGPTSGRVAATGVAAGDGPDSVATGAQATVGVASAEPGIPRPLSIQFVGAVISGLALHPTTVAVLL